MRRALVGVADGETVAVAYRRAAELCDEDVETCRRIGVHGLELIRTIAAGKSNT